MTLTEYLQTHQLRSLFTGSGIDSVTQTQVKEFFQFRELADDEKFGVYFNRLVVARAPQYLALLRAETTEWDPMVTEYMERQYLRSETRAGRNTETSSGSSTTSGQHSDTDTGKDVTTATSEVKDNGTSSGTETHSGTDTHGHEAETTGTHSEDTKTTDERSTTREIKAVGLNGTTPDSAVYATGGIPESGLDWKYASGQSEQRTGETTSDKGETNTERGGENKETVSGTDTTTYGQKIGTVGESSTTTNGTSETTLTRNGQRQGSTSSSGSTTGETSGTTNENIEGDDRERYTGRHAEAPQDLLDRARTYIIKTNAFMWLIDQLDICFMAVYNY